MVNRNDGKQRNVRVIEQQLNQSKNLFITKTLCDKKSPQCLKKHQRHSSKRKNLGHEKLSAPCTRPSRMPGCYAPRWLGVGRNIRATGLGK